MRVFHLFPAAAAAVTALCSAPTSSYSTSVWLPVPPASLSRFRDFYNNTAIGSPANVSVAAVDPPTRFVSSHGGSGLNETLVASTSTNASWAIEWELTDGTPGISLHNSEISSYSQKLSANTSCNGTLLSWETDVCVEGSQDAAGSYISKLHNLALQSLASEYGGAVGCPGANSNSTISTVTAAAGVVSSPAYSEISTISATAGTAIIVSSLAIAMTGIFQARNSSASTAVISASFPTFTSGSQNTTTGFNGTVITGVPVSSTEKLVLPQETSGVAPSEVAVLTMGLLVGVALGLTIF